MKKNPRKPKLFNGINEWRQTTQATMLKKSKNKVKRRNTEPSMAMATSGPSLSLAVAPQENDEIDSNNMDF